ERLVSVAEKNRCRPDTARRAPCNRAQPEPPSEKVRKDSRSYPAERSRRQARARFLRLDFRTCMQGFAEYGSARFWRSSFSELPFEGGDLMLGEKPPFARP